MRVIRTPASKLRNAFPKVDSITVRMGNKIHCFLEGAGDSHQAALYSVNFLFCFAAFFNITSNILRTNQTFNLTVQDSCTGAYMVDFGDGTTDNLTSAQKIVSHSYISPGNYQIQLQSGSAPSGCQTASKSVEVRDPIQNMVRNVFLAQFTKEQDDLRS